MKNAVKDLKDRLTEYRQRVGTIVNQNSRPQESKVPEEENSNRIQQTIDELDEIEKKRADNYA